MHKQEKSLWPAMHPADYWSTFYSPESFSALEILSTHLPAKYTNTEATLQQATWSYNSNIWQIATMTLTCNKTAQQQRLAQNNKTPTEVQFPPLLLTTQNKLKGFEINTRHMTPAAPPPPPPPKKKSLNSDCIMNKGVIHNLMDFSMFQCFFGNSFKNTPYASPLNSH